MGLERRLANVAIVLVLGAAGVIVIDRPTPPDEAVDGAIALGWDTARAQRVLQPGTPFVPADQAVVEPVALVQPPGGGDAGSSPGSDTGGDRHVAPPGESSAHPAPDAGTRSVAGDDRTDATTAGWSVTDPSTSDDTVGESPGHQDDEVTQRDDSGDPHSPTHAPTDPDGPDRPHAPDDPRAPDVPQLPDPPDGDDPAPGNDDDPEDEAIDVSTSTSTSEQEAQQVATVGGAGSTPDGGTTTRAGRDGGQASVHGPDGTTTGTSQPTPDTTEANPEQVASTGPLVPDESPRASVTADANVAASSDDTSGDPAPATTNTGVTTR